ncbi:transglutaminase-like domain-containing protein [Raineyella fluvialis]|nr:transglutaminase family protein [Raineyella fluvialis]
MRRTLHTTLSGELAGPQTVYAIVAAAATYAPSQESLSVTLDGEPADVSQLVGPHGTRLHRFALEPGARPAHFELAYDAVLDGEAPPPLDDPVDLPIYLRPSRYCESDRLGQLARERFGGLTGAVLTEAVTEWVHDHLAYVPGSTGPSHSTLDVLESRQGVCRDHAHLAISMLRARNTPARFVAVWAPGLRPMEFHAVAEAYVDGQWQVLDPTHLAPRRAMVRIATGRDAADTAFLSSYGAGLRLTGYRVRADIDELSSEERTAPVVLT